MKTWAEPGEKGTTAPASESLYYDDLPSEVKEQIVTHCSTSSNAFIQYTFQVEFCHILLQINNNNLDSLMAASLRNSECKLVDTQLYKVSSYLSVD